MDPRRARDPRLARVNRPQHDSSSSETLTPPIVDALPNHQTENGNPNSPPPSQPSVAQASPPSTPPNSSTPNSLYKPRPLFCVVCASNQVSKYQLLSHAYLRLQSRTVLWKAILFYREYLFHVFPLSRSSKLLHQQGRLSCNLLWDRLRCPTSRSFDR